MTIPPISIHEIPLDLTLACDAYQPIVERDGGSPASVAANFAAFARAQGLDARAEESTCTVVHSRRRSFTLDWAGEQGPRSLPVFGLTA